MKYLLLYILIAQLARSTLKECKTIAKLSEIEGHEEVPFSNVKIPNLLENPMNTYLNPTMVRDANENNNRVLTGFVCDDKTVSNCEEYIMMYSSQFEKQKENFACFVIKEGGNCQYKAIVVLTYLYADTSLTIYNTNSFLFFDYAMISMLEAIKSSLEREVRFVLSMAELGIADSTEIKMPIYFIDLWGSYVDSGSGRKILIPRFVFTTNDFYVNNSDTQPYEKSKNLNFEEYTEKSLIQILNYLKEVYHTGRSCEFIRNIYQLETERDFLTALMDDTNFPLISSHIDEVCNLKKMSAFEKNISKIKAVVYKYCSSEFNLDRQLIEALISLFGELPSDDIFLDSDERTPFENHFIKGESEEGMYFTKEECERILTHIEEKQVTKLDLEIIKLLREDMAEYIEKKPACFKYLEENVWNKYKAVNDKNLPQELHNLTFEYYYIIHQGKPEEVYVFHNMDLAVAFNQYIVIKASMQKPPTWPLVENQYGKYISETYKKIYDKSYGLNTDVINKNEKKSVEINVNGQNVNHEGSHIEEKNVDIVEDGAEKKKKGAEEQINDTKKISDTLVRRYKYRNRKTHLRKRFRRMRYHRY